MLADDTGRHPHCNNTQGTQNTTLLVDHTLCANNIAQMIIIAITESGQSRTSAVTSISKTAVHCLRHGVISCLHCQICHGRSMWFLHDLDDDCFGGRRVVAWYGISIVIQVSDVSRPRRNARGEDFSGSMPSEVCMRTGYSGFRNKSFD
jgi:hypothetical protein